MKFFAFKYFNGIANSLEDLRYTKTALYIAVEHNNYEVIKLLLTDNKLDINAGCIINIFFNEI